MAGTGRSNLGRWLHDAWSLSQRGGGRVVVLLGDPGMGKSTMLAALADGVGEQARLISCRGGDLAAPMSAVSELVTALSPDSQTGRHLRHEVDPLRAADMVCTELDGAGTTALLVDDIHEADPSSRTTLNLAMRRAAKAGMLTVFTARKVPAATSFAEGFDVRELTELGPDEALCVLQNASPVPVAPAVADHLIGLAAGNPLALKHLPAALTENQLSGSELLPDEIPLVGDLRAAFTRSLPPQHSAARELLDIAAVSADGSWAVLHALRPELAESGLEDLERAGLAELTGGRLVMQHPLMRSAVLGALPNDRCRRLHRELADVHTIADDQRLAHRAAGAIGPDEQLAGELETAAQTLQIRGGTDAAARLLDRAVDLTGDDARRLDLRLRSAEMLGVAGEAGAARHRLETVLAEAACRDRHVDAAIALATLEAVDGAPVTAHQRLMECLPLAAPEQRGLVHARMAIPLGMLGMAAQVVTTAEAAVAASPPQTPVSDIARVILAHAATAQDECWAAAHLDDLFANVDLLAAARLDPMLGLHVGRALSIAERYDTAVSALTELAGRLRGEGARSSLAMIFGALGETYIRASRFDEAVSCLDEAVALSFGTGQRAFAPFWLGLRARAGAIRGDDAAAAGDLELGFAISDEQSTFGARYFLLANAGLVAVIGRQYEQAAAHLGECWAFEQAAGLLAPHLARWHIDLVETHVASGRPGDAEPLVTRLVEVAGTPGASRWTRATALRAQALLIATEDVIGAIDLLRQAVAVYDSDADGFDRARTQFDIARLAPEPGLRDEARREALYAFRRLGAAPLAARLTEPDNSPQQGELTDAERRVLTAVSTGLTNRQIAKQLNLSAKTVANHLYSAYRKIGVGSRTEATRHILLNGIPATP